MVACRHRVAWLLFVLWVACAPATPARQRDDAGQRSNSPEEGSKTLTIGQPNPRRGFGPWFIAGSPRALQYEELHTNFLVTADTNGSPEARLAAALPSLSDHTITILPDGQMETIWKLKPNIQWHDGTPFTSDAIVFGWEVMAHPQIPVSRSPTMRAMVSVEPRGPQTAVITYREVYYKALELGFRELYPLPRHLLGDAFQGDKDAFINLPYFSAAYVHTGPFRLDEFIPGDRLTLGRFDDYFLGRPKVNSIVIRVIGDSNAMLSNLLAGAIDIAGELPTELTARLRDEWSQSGDGFVLAEPSFWRFISIQFHPEWGGPPELQADPRIRLGLLLALDRETIRAVVVPGFPNTEGDSFMLRGDPRSAFVGEPYAQYQYDPQRALQQLEAAGWRRGAEGRLLNSTGQQVRLSIRASGEYETELSAVASGWRALGFEVAQELIPRALARDNEYLAKFPGMEITAQGTGDGILRRFDSRLHPVPENRYAGSNPGHYVNPALDRLIDRLYGTLESRDQGLILKEIGEILASDLPALPMYFHVSTVAALGHVRGLVDFPGSSQAGTSSRSAHLWARA